MSKKIIVLILVMMTGLACNATSNLLGSNNADNENINNGITPSDLDENASSINNPVFQEGPNLLDLSDPNLFSVAENSNANIFMLMTFDGQDDSGATVFGQVQMDGMVSNDLPGAFIELTMEGDAAFDGVGYLVMVDLPTTDYFYTAETGCLSFGNNEFDSPYNDFMQTADFVGTVSKVDSNVEVDGFQTDKYLITMENIPEDSFEDNELVELYESYLYVVQNGGFIIRVELNWLGANEALTGSETLLGENSAIYKFIPISGTVEISPPAECDVSEKTGSVDYKYPVLPDATGISSLGEDFIQYNTATGLEDAVVFYETEMISRGYSLVNSASYGDAAFVTYELSGKQVSLIIAKVDGNSEYSVTIGGE